MGVILRCKLATHKKYMLKIANANVTLFQISSAMILQNIMLISLQLGKLLQK